MMPKNKNMAQGQAGLSLFTNRGKRAPYSLSFVDRNGTVVSQLLLHVVAAIWLGHSRGSTVSLLKSLPTWCTFLRVAPRWGGIARHRFLASDFTKRSPPKLSCAMRRAKAAAAARDDVCGRDDPCSPCTKRLAPLLVTVGWSAVAHLLPVRSIHGPLRPLDG